MGGPRLTARRWKLLTLISLMALIGGAGISAPSALAVGDRDNDGIPDAVEIGLDAANPIDADPDYTRRPEPSRTVEALQGLRAHPQ